MCVSLFLLYRSDGCVMPLGHTHDTGVRNTAGYTLNYNEFVVYDTCQVINFIVVVIVIIVVFLQIKMRYLVRLKFDFN